MPRPLHAELKSARPFDLLEEEAHLSIFRTAAQIEHAFSQVLKPYGLTQTQYNVLRILRGAGPGGLCRNEVGARLVRQVPDVTRLLDRMTEMRLIGRQRSDSDRRLVRTNITPKGLEVLASLDEPVRDVSPQRTQAHQPGEASQPDRGARRSATGGLTAPAFFWPK